MQNPRGENNGRRSSTTVVPGLNTAVRPISMQVDTRKSSNLDTQQSQLHSMSNLTKTIVFTSKGETETDYDLNLQVINYEEYTNFLFIRKKRIRIFLVCFTAIFSLMCLVAFITVYGILPCLFYKCHANAFCINTAFIPKCYCKYGFSGNGKTDCDECGLSFFKEASAHSHPYQVFIYKRVKSIFLGKNNSKIPTEIGHFCGGTLINKRFVLASAQCSQPQMNSNGSIFKYRISTETNYWVFVGHDDLKTINAIIENRTIDLDLSVLALSVEKVIIHDDFDPITFESDIALLKLSEDVNLADTVQLICLPVNLSASYPFANDTSASTLSWSTSIGTLDRFPSNGIKSIKTNVLNNSMCATYYPIKNKTNRTAISTTCNMPTNSTKSNSTFVSLPSTTTTTTTTTTTATTTATTTISTTPKITASRSNSTTNASTTTKATSASLSSTLVTTTHISTTTGFRSNLTINIIDAFYVDELNETYTPLSVQYNSTSMICSKKANMSGLVNACMADFDGPLIVRDNRARFVLVGIAINGIDCGVNKNKPSVFTRISNFMDWILENSDY